MVRLIGLPCRMSWVTFRKLATDCRALLRKITHQDKASYLSSSHSLVFCVVRLGIGLGKKGPYVHEVRDHDSLSS